MADSDALERLFQALREINEDPMVSPMCECPSIAIPFGEGPAGYTVKADPDKLGTCCVCRLWAAFEELEES